MLLVTILQCEDLCPLQPNLPNIAGAFNPPAYLNFAGKPHVGGITLNRPPLSN